MQKNYSKIAFDHTLENVVTYLNKIFHDAIYRGASDIHFEPYELSYRIRFRIDGILISVDEPPKQFANNITARLKILANLDISERRLPQDGRIKLQLSANSAIDCRVSTCPTLQGEKIVLRMLETNLHTLQLDNLGMNSQQIATFTKALAQSQGLILVTGPTGSGKTVSLYTGLCHLNTLEKNISTVEDPVEIQIPGINQVPINIKTGLNFATALRAILRQDPDIIMVGEIRDLETAQIAVNASQTGHLVLSTLHTNSTSETLIRLANMGVPAYNIASAISLIIAQRLVRQLCIVCKIAQTLPVAITIQEGFLESEIPQLKLYGPGTDNCHHCTDGYDGRVGIYEVMPISATMTEIILTRANVVEIQKQAHKEGILTLRESALDKVRTGITSLCEINRVIT